MTISSEDLARMPSRNRNAAYAASTSPAAGQITREDAIMALPEAQGQPDEARHIAFKTNMTVGQAQACLKAGTGKSASPQPAAAAAAPAIPSVNRGARTLALAAAVGLKGYS